MHNMKTKYAFAIILLLVFAACGKDKFTTEPQVKIKDIAPDPVFNGDIIKINATFTDEEGDLDSVLVVYKWYNGTTPSRIDTFRNTLKDLNIPPKTRDADLIVQYAYGKIITDYVTIGAVAKDTTASFGLLLVDKMNQRSSYEESDKIRLKKP